MKPKHKDKTFTGKWAFLKQNVVSLTFCVNIINSNSCILHRYEFVLFFSIRSVHFQKRRRGLKPEKLIYLANEYNKRY